MLGMYLIGGFLAVAYKLFGVDSIEGPKRYPRKKSVMNNLGAVVTVCKNKVWVFKSITLEPLPSHQI